MAPKKAIANKPYLSTSSSYVSQLIRDCNIPDSIKIRSLIKEEENKWRTLGLGLGFGKKTYRNHSTCHPSFDFAIFICSTNLFDVAHSKFSQIHCGRYYLE